MKLGMETQISSSVQKKFRPKIKILHPTLYVVANRSDAVFYAESPKKAFHFLARLENPRARLAERKLVSDRPGRTFSSPATGKARSSLEPKSTQQEELSRKFARKIVDRLEKIRDDHQYERMILVAGPSFLGVLRDTLGPALRKLITQELPREYVRGSDRAISRRIRSALASQGHPSVETPL